MAGVAGTTIVAGATGGNAFQMVGSGSNVPFAFTSVPLGDRIIVGYRFKWNGGDVEHAILTDTLGTNHVRFAVTAGGIFGTGTVGGSQIGVTVLSTGVWYYVEWEIITHDTLGEIHCRLNGITEEISVTGIDTRASGSGILSSITFLGASGRTVTIDDVYIRYATAGETAKTSWYGDIRVDSLFPTGAGNSTQFTPSTGSNWQNVDDADIDSDSTYNQSSTLNHKDTYVTGNLSSTGTIYGVQSQIYARKTDAGARSVGRVYRISSTDYVSTGKPLTIDYIYLDDLTEVSPATASAWTVSEINALEIGAQIIL